MGFRNQEFTWKKTTKQLCRGKRSVKCPSYVFKIRYIICDSLQTRCKLSWRRYYTIIHFQITKNKQISKDCPQKSTRNRVININFVYYKECCTFRIGKCLNKPVLHWLPLQQALIYQPFVCHIKIWVVFYKGYDSTSTIFHKNVTGMHCHCTS